MSRTAKGRFKKEPPFHPLLKCGIVRLEYDFTRWSGMAWFAEGHCCAMPGCIELFEGIDSECKYIFTFSGSKPDTAYLRTGAGAEWKCWPDRRWRWHEALGLPVRCATGEVLTPEEAARLLA